MIRVDVSVVEWQTAHSQNLAPQCAFLSSGRLSRSAAAQFGTQNYLRQEGHLPFIHFPAGLNVFGYLQAALIN